MTTLRNQYAEMDTLQIDGMTIEQETEPFPDLIVIRYGGVAHIVAISPLTWSSWCWTSAAKGQPGRGGDGGGYPTATAALHAAQRAIADGA